MYFEWVFELVIIIHV